MVVTFVKDKHLEDIEFLIIFNDSTNSPQTIIFTILEVNTTETEEIQSTEPLPPHVPPFIHPFRFIPQMTQNIEQHLQSNIVTPQTTIETPHVNVETHENVDNLQAKASNPLASADIFQNETEGEVPQDISFAPNKTFNEDIKSEESAHDAQRRLLFKTNKNSFSSLHLQSNKLRRKLLDTFADSLRYVNRIYNKIFGRETRSVPAHMPHYLKKSIISELHSTWPEEYEQTSSHKFRSADDMQFSFSLIFF